MGAQMNTQGLGRALNNIFESCAEREELDLPRGEFVARNGKVFNFFDGTTVGLHRILKLSKRSWIADFKK